MGAIHQSENPIEPHNPKTATSPSLLPVSLNSLIFPHSLSGFWFGNDCNLGKCQSYFLWCKCLRFRDVWNPNRFDWLRIRCVGSLIWLWIDQFHGWLFFFFFFWGCASASAQAVLLPLLFNAFCLSSEACVSVFCLIRWCLKPMLSHPLQLCECSMSLYISVWILRGFGCSLYQYGMWAMIANMTQGIYWYEKACSLLVFCVLFYQHKLKNSYEKDLHCCWDMAFTNFICLYVYAVHFF